MAINPESQYPGKINPSDASYPYGSARNITTPSDGTGTPWEAALVNDLFGFQQALLKAGGDVTPSGSPDTIIDSQYLTALLQLLAQSGYNPQRLGAALDGVTDDLSPIAAALAAIGTDRNEINLRGLTALLSATPTNTYGVPFKGGKVLVPSLIGGFNTQLNTYADDINGLMVARENLAAFWLSLTDTPSPAAQTVYIYGDSTVANSVAYPLYSHELFERAMWSSGINGVGTVNRGVGGTSWSDLSALGDLGASTKLIVIKYGINDAVKGSPLTTLMADARAKLSAIRADANGGFESLSILLMGPNSTYRPSTGQDAKWYEDLRNCYVQLAKEFNCAYFDTYAYLQDSSLSPGFWQDDIGGAGEGLHPNPDAVWWIWYEGIRTHVFGNGEFNQLKSNRFWNHAYNTVPADPALVPTDYQFGITIQQATEADGFPANGQLVTIRTAGTGIAVQHLHTQDTNPITYTRRGGAGVWTLWTGDRVLFVSPTHFQNSWVNALGGFAVAGCVSTPDGFVELFGAISGGTNGIAIQLPTNMQPVASHKYLVANNATVTVFGSGAGGTVNVSTADNTHVSLSGIRFRIDNT